MPLYDKPLRALDHRLLWWLLDHQTVERGKPTGAVKEGWRTQALDELKTHRPLLWAAERRLRNAGVITSEKNQRSLVINAKAFE